LQPAAATPTQQRGAVRHGVPGAALHAAAAPAAVDAVFANSGQPNRVCAGDGSGGFAACSEVSTDANRSFGVAVDAAARDQESERIGLYIPDPCSLFPVVCSLKTAQPPLHSRP